MEPILLEMQYAMKIVAFDLHGMLICVQQGRSDCYVYGEIDTLFKRFRFVFLGLVFYLDISQYRKQGISDVRFFHDIVAEIEPSGLRFKITVKRYLFQGAHPLTF